MSSLKPTFYRPPLGLPLRWQDEQSGRLPEAVKAYFERRATPAQLQLVINYVSYYINAPCWTDNAIEEENRAALAALRQSVRTLNDAKSLLDWIYECLEIGIDPL